jgi:hypothetical protein
MTRDKTSHELCEGGGETESARAGGAAEAALVGGPGRIVAVAGVDGVGAMGVRGGGTPVIRAMTRAR